MLFSVIVPIYKIEKYLARCIDSVLSQSFADFELILVDDGSPDSCGEICDAYAQKDKRIKVIHKENGGLVSARQAGIRIASGAYTINLDGDDALCLDALENACKIIEDTQADIVTFTYRTYTDGRLGDVVEDTLQEGLYERPRMEAEIFPKLLSDQNMKNIVYFSCGKAIKRELSLKHQLRVDTTLTTGEDIGCVVPCFMEAQRVYISKTVTYLYTVRTDSMSRDFKIGQIKQLERVVEYLRGIHENTPPDFQDQIARYSCYMSFVTLVAAAEGSYFAAAKPLKAAILDSANNELIRKAQFDRVTPKSRIAIFLMKRGWFITAFYFLYICKKIKDIRKGGKA